LRNKKSDKSSKEGCILKRAVFPMTTAIMMIMMILNNKTNWLSRSAKIQQPTFVLAKAKCRVGKKNKTFTTTKVEVMVNDEIIRMIQNM
jgi:hypothetical protein